MKKWTRATIKRAIRGLIQQPNVTIRKRALKKNLAQSTWTRDKGSIVITIYVDDGQVGVVSSVIHELLHIALEKEIPQLFDETLEEGIIDGLERSLYTHISKSPSQLAWWRKAIERRIR